MQRPARASFGCMPLLILGVLAGGLALFAQNTDLQAIFAPAAAPDAASTQEVGSAAATLEAEYPATPEVTPPPAPTATSTPVHLAALPDVPLGTFVVVPKIGIQAPIVRAYRSGTSWDVARLARYAGHLEGTAAPGETGNVVLAGHVELANGVAGPFAHLKDAAPGDALYLLQEGKQTAYTIIEVRYTDETDLSPIQRTDDDRVTLITCDNYDFVSNIYQRRLVVVAEKSGI